MLRKQAEALKNNSQATVKGGGSSVIGRECFATNGVRKYFYSKYNGRIEFEAKYRKIKFKWSLSFTT